MPTTTKAPSEVAPSAEKEPDAQRTAAQQRQAPETTEQKTEAAAPATTDNDPTDPPREPEAAEPSESAETTESTEAPAAAPETTTSEPAPTAEPEPAVPVATQQEGGPIVQLLNAVSSPDSNSAFGRVKQVLVVALGIGFLTTAGFAGATWYSRHATGQGSSKTPGK
ncbi:hypothetical protein CIK72_14495 [Brachybacterium alimentarium]|uniref:hypothetical protein n=1 Tax=Brachybacterium alimentarium TaxID=47845 RepID=UPI000BB76425|nr:hypothetical protein CIK71_03550 [Brachybacterium alimentarium]RCS67361.1 hypothetical protein CIK73_11215 [Brachybacterium alimentarium]RCS77132.1 hypothetical protein CIK72_14495 [Brachybacterium alimentarium]RCS80713.1 hypothetical protein CIK70_05885 [Brachybacterium alimentarium]